VWPLLKALLLFLTFTVLADTVGLPVVRRLARRNKHGRPSGTSPRASPFLLIFARFIAFLIGASAETGAAVGGARFVPVGNVKSIRLSSSARQAAKSLSGADAEEVEILKKAREIEAGWAIEFPGYEDSCRNEAAHALVAHHFGATVLDTHVKPEGSGMLQWVLPSPRPTSQDEAWMRICIAMAGNVQDHLDDRHDAGSAKDMQQITEHVAVLLSIGQKPPGGVPRSFDSIFGAARQQIREILSGRTNEVNLLAQAIAAHGYYPGHWIHAELRTKRESAETRVVRCKAADGLDAHTTRN
jgi:hypothetical protein